MGPDHALATLRAAARLSNAFVLELVKLGGHRRDVIDPLIRTALLQANQGHILRDPALAHSYATLDDEVPDDLRRPASVNAIATSLRIPFETARRRIGTLVELGVCRASPAGVIVPAAATNGVAYRMACGLQYEKLRLLYGRLRGIGFFDSPLPAPRPYNRDDPPLRLAGRLVVDYVLRFTEPISEHIGDLVTGLVLMEMIHANTEHLPDDFGSVEDQERRPVSAANLAANIGVPQETVRRHLGRLEAGGLATHVKGGWILPSDALARPAFHQALVDNARHLQRMFYGLAEFGVLAAWELERQGRAA